MLELKLDMPESKEGRYARLLEQARSAQPRAYAPYSFQGKGAAVLGSSGKVYLGCTVELASYAGSICAEAAAVCQGILNGEESFDLVAIYPEALPCGTCRQMMAEFNPQIELVTGGPDTDAYKVFTLAQILPANFGPHSLAESVPPPKD